MWVNCNLARKKNLQESDASKIIEIACVGLHVESSEIRGDCLWALFFASDNTENNLNELINNNEAMLRVIDMLGDKD